MNVEGMIAEPWNGLWLLTSTLKFGCVFVRISWSWLSRYTLEAAHGMLNAALQRTTEFPEGRIRQVVAGFEYGNLFRPHLPNDRYRGRRADPIRTGFEHGAHISEFADAAGSLYAAAPAGHAAQ